MNNKKIAVTFISLAMLLSLIVYVIEISPRVGAPITWYVDESNPGPGDGSPGNPFKTIQAGVDNATPGDTVYVFNGTYYEHVVVNKTINLTGEDRDKTIINASGIGDVMRITSDWVNVSGFTLTYGGNDSYDAGMDLKSVKNCYIYSNNFSFNIIKGISLYDSIYNRITNNIVLENWYGIYLSNSSNNIITNNMVQSNIRCGILVYESSSNNTIINNTADSNGRYGILISQSSNDNLIKYNNAQSNLWDGIYLYGYSNYNNISNNNVSNNSNGIHLYYGSDNNMIDNNTALNNSNGIYLSYSDNNTIVNNIFEFNIRGIWPSHSEYNTITNNIANSNSNQGIYLYGSSNNTITKNFVSNNDDHNIYLYYHSNFNLIYHNNFICKTNQAFDDGKNYWNATYPKGGNYWSDYSGIDNFKGPNQDIPGRDGIGDTNYSIDSDSIDNYPLIGPYPDFPTKNYTILKQGWNLVSIPLIQNNQSLKKVLEMINGYYDAVQWYNITDISDPWKHNKINKSFGNDLYKINKTMGFWIHITKPGDTIFIYNGTQPINNQTIDLSPGWNLVGYPSLTVKNRTDALNNINFGSDLDAIWTYNATAQKWKEITASDNFEVGRGYWMHSKVTKTWIVPL
jgi:parallel beta-helix repeat protein